MYIHSLRARRRPLPLPDRLQAQVPDLLPPRDHVVRELQAPGEGGSAKGEVLRGGVGTLRHFFPPSHYRRSFYVFLILPLAASQSLLSLAARGPAGT